LSVRRTSADGGAHGRDTSGCDRRDQRPPSSPGDSEITLCVLLWAHEGQEDSLAEYESHALARVVAHGGQVLYRVRRVGASGPADEVQLLRFPDAHAYQAFLDDPSRLALRDVRDRAVARTELVPVQSVVLEGARLRRTEATPGSQLTS
jgi:uncharacterized protein (DUF1330 family)